MNDPTRPPVGSPGRPGAGPAREITFVERLVMRLVPIVATIDLIGGAAGLVMGIGSGDGGTIAWGLFTVAIGALGVLRTTEPGQALLTSWGLHFTRWRDLA